MKYPFANELSCLLHSLVLYCMHCISNVTILALIRYNLTNNFSLFICPDLFSRQIQFYKSYFGDTGTCNFMSVNASLCNIALAYSQCSFIPCSGYSPLNSCVVQNVLPLLFHLVVQGVCLFSTFCPGLSLRLKVASASKTDSGLPPQATKRKSN